MTRLDAIRRPSAAWLRAEFGLFFLAAPLAMAVLIPPEMMFRALFAVTAIGALLLHGTQNFLWRDLARGGARIQWAQVAAIGVATFAFGAGLLWLTRPDALFAIARFRPELMIMILALYPLVSALPQEVIYRALFFRRYGDILPRDRRAALVLNAVLFALAHLMYWSWLVLFMTFLGGLAFAWAYELRRSFPMAVLMHAVAGNAIFLVGLGIYFYSGNVEQPF